MKLTAVLENLNHYYTFLLGIILLFSFTLKSCKPDTPDSGPEDCGFFTLGEAKNYIFFKQGTWWVYKNSRTGLQDSIEVTYSTLDTMEATSKKWHIREELFLIQSKSFTTGNLYTFYKRQSAVEVTNQPRNFVNPILERRSPFEGDVRIFFYPFDFLQTLSGSGYDFAFLTKLDNLVINGKSYSDVAIFYIKSDASEPYPMKHNAAKYYWAKNYGLIKKDLFRSDFLGDTATLYHSWELISSHINQ